MMRPPRFWSRPKGQAGPVSAALLPLSWLWRAATARRLRRGPWARMRIPVICVGNLTAGGTGKTPTVAAIVQRLSARGVAAGALYRGYGGRLAGPVEVDAARMTAADVGDEALLTAAFGPTWIARDRAAGVRAMAASGVSLAVLDDGFQNAGVARDLDILVVDAETGFGNGRVIPAGPLREPVEAGLKRAGMILTIGPEAAQERVSAHWPEIDTLPRLRGRLEPLATGMSWTGLRVFAFAGIGRPAKFFDTLKGLGAEIAGTQEFPDHACYSPAILQRLKTDAARLGAQLVTTEKDAVRLPDAFRKEVLALPVRLVLQDWTPLDRELDRLPGAASE